MSTSSTHRRILRGRDAAPACFLLEPSGGSHPQRRPTMAEMLEQARQEGRAEGYASAMTEVATAEAAARSAQLRRVADAVVEAAVALQSTRKQAFQAAGAEIGDLACALAEAFLEHELSIGRPAVEAVLRALELAPEGVDLIIRLNPDDALDANELRSLLADSLSDPRASIEVVADSKVEPGGCVLTAGTCRIDTAPATAMERARRVLAEVYP